ncbi:MAG: DUF4406 domain-containing protein [Anaerolineae bacterium]
MKIIYIAGPYSAPNSWAREQNIRVAEKAGLQVLHLGAMPLVPHTMTRFYFGAVPETTVIEGDLELLRRSDAVLFVGDWENSEGSMEELEEARRLNLPGFLSIDDLLVWLRAQWFKELHQQALQELSR